MVKSLLRLGAKLLLAWIIFHLSFNVWGAPLKLAVATNFKPTLSLLAERYQQQTGIKLQLSAASTGVLYAQIRHGAPFDLFFAADVSRPQQLEQQKLVLANSRQTYASGVLVLYAKQNLSAAELLSTEKVLAKWQGKIAIANPKLAPYGMAAKQVLAALGRWTEAEQNRLLVRGNSVAHAVQFVETGNVKLGFVGLAQVKQQKGRYWPVEPHLYKGIEQQLVVLKRTKQPKTALALVDWIMAPAQQQLIQSAGYKTASVQTERN